MVVGELRKQVQKDFRMFRISLKLCVITLQDMMRWDPTDTPWGNARASKLAWRR